MKHKTNPQGFAVIVYPEESGTMLSQVFLQHGIECLCICPQYIADADINSCDYHQVIYSPTSNDSDANINALSTALQAYPLLCVLPGSERGVPLADQLSAHLKLLTNDPRHSEGRCNKSIMAKTAAAAGLQVPWQVTVESDEQLNRLIASTLNWPVILKPAASMGSEDVSLCADSESLRAAFSCVINTENRLGRKNKVAIIQAYLQGTEYAIDTVSYAGEHQVTAIWQYYKFGNEIIGVVPFNSKRLLNSQGPVQTSLLRYTWKLLGALGIQYGPAHTELVIENGVVYLMEVGARLHGGELAMHMSRSCSGQSQVDICALAYAEPEIFTKELQTDYALSSHGEIVLLITPHQGLYANASCVNTIRALTSVTFIHINTTTDQPLDRVAGVVLLNNADQQVMEYDLVTIRKLEKTDLYIFNVSHI